jgi:hypothetical protein
MVIRSRHFRLALLSASLFGLFVGLTAHTLHQDATQEPPNLNVNVICENPAILRVTNQGGPMVDAAQFRVLHTTNGGSQESLTSGQFQLDSGHIYEEEVDARPGLYELVIYGRDGSVIATYGEDCTQPPAISVALDCSPDTLVATISNKALTDRATYDAALDLEHDGDTTTLRSEAVELGAYDSAEWSISPVEIGTYSLRVTGADGAALATASASCIDPSEEAALAAQDGGLGEGPVVWPLLAVAGAMALILIGGGLMWVRSTRR